MVCRGQDRPQDHHHHLPRCPPSLQPLHAITTRYPHHRTRKAWVGKGDRMATGTRRKVQEMVGTEADEVAVEEAVGSEVGGEAEVVEEEEGNGYGRSMSDSRSFPSKSADGDCFSSCIEAGRFDIPVPSRVQWGDPRGAHLLDTQII